MADFMVEAHSSYGCPIKVILCRCSSNDIVVLILLFQWNMVLWSWIHLTLSEYWQVFHCVLPLGFFSMEGGELQIMRLKIV